MGQTLLDPPTVEGWHTGHEWINGGTLTERVNFSADLVGDVSKPGISALVGRIASRGQLSPAEVVDLCRDELGPVELNDDTRAALLRHVEADGEFAFGTDQERETSASRIAKVLQLIVATKEYQFA
jgi:hypothetical protein